MPTEAPEQTSSAHTAPVRETISRRMVTLFLLLFPALYFLPGVIGQNLLTLGDGWVYCFPLRILVGNLLADGHLPLWNPYTFGGGPLLAAIQPGALYPVNWLFAILSPGAAMNAAVLSTWYIALWGAYRFARVLSLCRMASLITGVVFSFGGFMMAHLDQTNFTAAAAWLPWIMLATEKLYQHAITAGWRSLWRWVAIGAALIALQLFAGLPQSVWQTILVAGPWYLFSLLWRRETHTDTAFRPRFLFAGLVMAVCGALLAAIQLLPLRELQQQGERAAIPYEAFSIFSMPPRLLLSLIMPFFFGGGMGPLYGVSGWDEWWMHKWVHGYAGVTGLSLALLAALMSRALPGSRRVILFWAGLGLAALFLALGDHLPLGLHHLFYRIPVYNLFRAPYRHLYEFNFAIATLAGFGAHGLAHMEWTRARRALRISAGVMTVLLALTAVFWLFFGHATGAAQQAPAGRSLLNAEVLVPIAMLSMGIAAMWFQTTLRARMSALLLLTVVTLDMVSFGWFLTWRLTNYQAVARLADPPAVQAIKAREKDLHGFRIMGHSAYAYGRNYENLNFGNLTIARGLQSATGYDPMRLVRQAALAGDLDIFGNARDPAVFGAQHQGFNLLNVRYLLRDRSQLLSERSERIVTIDGVRFEEVPLEYTLAPGGRREFEVNGFAATELALVSALTNSGAVADQAPVARVRLRTRDGQLIEREILAGRDTAEWAWDRSDVRGAIRHQRARIAESLPAGDGGAPYEAHRYMTRLTIDRADIDSMEIENVRADASLSLARASLVDTQTGKTMALDRERLPAARWRLVDTFGEVELYENLHALPRAWFVSQVTALPSAQVLQTIKTAALPDGTAYDPASVALVETEDLMGKAIPTATKDDRAAVSVQTYEPQRIGLTTRNTQPGFLTLSETSYQGWDAFIDGQQTAVYRTNYALRGIAVPPGQHQIEFRYRPRPVYQGAIAGLLGLLILLCGGLVIRFAPGSVLVKLHTLSPSRIFESPLVRAWRARLLTDAKLADRLTLLFLVLLPPLLFWRETMGWYTLGGGDAVNQFFPAFAEAIRQLGAGQLPLWNPGSYSGMPLFADSQLGLLNPLNWVYFISLSIRAITISQLLTFAVSLLAASAWARALGWRRRAAVVTAVIYALSGFAVARVLYPAMPAVYAITPLVFCCIERLYAACRYGTRSDSDGNNFGLR
ncbi:MAG: YfhO family protein, partial [Blastocatellia bacterium]